MHFVPKWMVCNHRLCFDIDINYSIHLMMHSSSLHQPALKAATDEKHGALNKELDARKTEVKNISQIKDEQLEKVAILDESITGLESKDAENEKAISELQAIDEKLTTSIDALQHTAAEDSAKLDELEEQCTDLSNQLQESETALAETQEMERKCSREYIAYEKVIRKREAAQKVKGKGRFGS